MVAPYRKRGAGPADLEAVPENMVGELLSGELWARPRPAAPHVVAASSLGTKLGAPFQFGDGGPGGWWILHEPELHLGPDVLVPDLAGWRRERMPEPPETGAFTLGPDWICEVLSPSTEVVDRTRKRPVYLREKVRHLWLLDPVARNLEVFERGDGNWVLIGSYAEDALVRAPPFEAVELDLLVLWGKTRGG
ncbi:MAG TPA: hypothetical protein DFS52_13995 [Myxococcales bacterium]|nr:hypothetical protein [Myxococcales bacterium]